jgi:predicted transcriptional regulator YdeE
MNTNRSKLDIVFKDSFLLFGLSTKAPSSFSTEAPNSTEILVVLWGKLIAALIAAGESPHREMFGATCPADDEVPPQVIDYFAGSTLAIEGLETISVPAGMYLRYVHNGPKSAVEDSFRDAYLNIFAKSGLTDRDALHLEIYPADFDSSAEVITFEILIPINSLE